MSVVSKVCFGFFEAVHVPIMANVWGLRFGFFNGVCADVAAPACIPLHAGRGGGPPLGQETVVDLSGEEGSSVVDGEVVDLTVDVGSAEEATGANVLHF